MRHNHNSAALILCLSTGHQRRLYFASSSRNCMRSVGFAQRMACLPSMLILWIALASSVNATVRPFDSIVYINVVSCVGWSFSYPIG